MISKTIVYKLTATVELSSQEKTILERFPALQKMEIYKSNLQGTPIGISISLLQNSFPLVESESTLTLSESEAELLSMLQNFKSHLEYLGATEAERVVEI